MSSVVLRVLALVLALSGAVSADTCGSHKIAEAGATLTTYCGCVMQANCGMCVKTSGILFKKMEAIQCVDGTDAGKAFGTCDANYPTWKGDTSLGKARYTDVADCVTKLTEGGENAQTAMTVINIVVALGIFLALLSYYLLRFRFWWRTSDKSFCDKCTSCCCACFPWCQCDCEKKYPPETPPHQLCCSDNCCCAEIRTAKKAALCAGKDPCWYCVCPKSFMECPCGLCQRREEYKCGLGCACCCVPKCCLCCCDDVYDEVDGNNTSLPSNGGSKEIPTTAVPMGAPGISSTDNKDQVAVHIGQAPAPPAPPQPAPPPAPAPAPAPASSEPTVAKRVEQAADQAKDQAKQAADQAKNKAKDLAAQMFGKKDEKKVQG